ncbi:barstar family protein [Pantoea agglomerans]|nr:barstar family protein [Pantoea agglomerans]AYP22838.1 barnase inhibitor [Pantoea agglomerans]MCX2201167.1 barstar family protein [Pantoea agglomerans]
MYRNVIIEGDEVDSERDFHRVIANALDFGEYYGNNTDALWDMLSSGMACGVCINWKKSSVSRKKLGSTFEVIVYLFEKTKDRYQGKGSEKEFEFTLE